MPRSTGSIPQSTILLVEDEYKARKPVLINAFQDRYSILWAQLPGRFDDEACMLQQVARFCCRQALITLNTFKPDEDGLLEWWLNGSTAGSRLCGQYQ